MSQPAKKGRPPTPGVIEPTVLYRLDEFRRRAGLGDWAMRMVRKQGLRVVKVGNVGFVRGQDFIDFVSRLSEGGGATADSQSQEPGRSDPGSSQENNGG